MRALLLFPPPPGYQATPPEKEFASLVWIAQVARLGYVGSFWVAILALLYDFSPYASIGALPFFVWLLVAEWRIYQVMTQDLMKSPTVPQQLFGSEVYIDARVMNGFLLRLYAFAVTMLWSTVPLWDVLDLRLKCLLVSCGLLYCFGALVRECFTINLSPR